MENKKDGRGGYRPGAGRKRVEGVRHAWIVPHDIEKIYLKRGTEYLWECVRFAETFRKFQRSEQLKENKSET